MDKHAENFGKFLGGCMETRIEQLGNTLAENEEYRSIKAEQAALFKEIKAGLPEQLKDKIEQYSEFQIQLSGLEQPYFYQNGGSDIVRLVKFCFGDVKAVPQE